MVNKPEHLHAVRLFEPFLRYYNAPVAALQYLASLDIAQCNIGHVWICDFLRNLLLLDGTIQRRYITKQNILVEHIKCINYTRIQQIMSN